MDVAYLTRVSPFFANKGYDPAITIHPEYELASSCAHQFVTDLSELHEELRKAILSSQEQYQLLGALNYKKLIVNWEKKEIAINQV